MYVSPAEIEVCIFKGEFLSMEITLDVFINLLRVGSSLSLCTTSTKSYRGIELATAGRDLFRFPFDVEIQVLAVIHYSYVRLLLT